MLPKLHWTNTEKRVSKVTGTSTMKLGIYGDEAHPVVNLVNHILDHVVFSQMAVIMLAASFLLGAYYFHGLAAFLELASELATASIFVLGGASLWMLHNDRRKEKKYLVTIVAIIIAMALVSMLPEPWAHAFLFVHSVFLLILMVLLFVIAYRSWAYSRQEREDTEPVKETDTLF